MSSQLTKEQQRQLLGDMMADDEADGLYDGPDHSKLSPAQQSAASRGGILITSLADMAAAATTPEKVE